MVDLSKRFGLAASGLLLLTQSAVAEMKYSDLAPARTDVTLTFGDVGAVDMTQIEPMSTPNQCQPKAGQDAYINSMLVNDSVATQFIAFSEELARTLFSRAFVNRDVMPDRPGDVQFLQQLLMRAGCYADQSKRQDDGVFGDATIAAIESFMHSYGQDYIDTDGFIRDPETNAVIGIERDVLRPLAGLAVKDVIHTNHLIRQANMSDDMFNEHGYRIAIYKELRSHYLGQADPDYAPLQFSERDIDIAARTVFGEARGEPREGQIAVIHNILNRTVTATLDGYGTPLQFKSTLEETCKAASQYSAWNKDDPNYAVIQAITEDGDSEGSRIFREIKQIVRDVIAGRIPDPTHGADHYHTNAVHPDWAAGQQVVHREGPHQFYDIDPQIDLRDEFLADILPIFESIRYMREWSQRTATSTPQTHTLN